MFERQDSVRTWARNQEILAKNFAALCLCPANLSKTEFKMSELICLMGERIAFRL